MVSHVFFKKLTNSATTKQCTTVQLTSTDTNLRRVQPATKKTKLKAMCSFFLWQWLGWTRSAWYRSNIKRKDAAEGRSSASDNLPHLLRRSLPISASALKQEYNTRIKAKWLDMWNTSPRKPRLDQLGGTFPFSAFLKKLNLLTRKQSSIILQIRCGHFPLNAYLYKINKAESNRCQACIEHHEGGSPPESINHFLFDCPAHHEAREILVNKIGRNYFHLAEIMADTDRMKALVTFINRTGRLRN